MQGTLKDKVTNICAVVMAVTGSIVTAHASGQVTLPEWIIAVCGLLFAISSAIVGVFTGKTGDGKPKSE
jgi:hypothetical protein